MSLGIGNFQKVSFFCFTPMKISPNLYGRMDGSKFWCFPWFPENVLLCVILRYTVYLQKSEGGPSPTNKLLARIERETFKQGILFRSHIWVTVKLWVETCLVFVTCLLYNTFEDVDATNSNTIARKKLSIPRVLLLFCF